MPELRRLVITGDPSAWTEAGFTMDGDRTTLGTIEVVVVPGADPGVVGWELAGLDEPAGGGPGHLDGIDGIATEAVDRPQAEATTHPNGVIRMDHVVIRTPDLDRTIGALETAGFEVRRTRDVPGSSPTIRQVFLWAGEAILEVVGPADGPEATDTPGTTTEDRPAVIWGLALTTDDLDGAADLLGDRLTTPRDAVQPGRRIAAIDTGALGIGPSLALMTPHVGGSPRRPDRE